MTAAKLMSQLFDGQSDSIVWFTPIFNESSSLVADFEVVYCNDAAATILGVSMRDVVGERLRSTDLMDKESLKQIFDQCTEVWQTHKNIEYTYYSPGFDRYFNVQRRLVESGILSITRDKTAEIKAGLEKEQQAQLLQSLIHSSPYGVVLYEARRDEDGTINDFRTRIFNQKSVELTGLTEQEFSFRSLHYLVNERENQNFFNLAVDVIETGKPHHSEYYSRFLKKWFSLSIMKFEDGVLVNFFDISRRKRLEDETRLQAFKLDQILNASLNAIFMCEAVRDETGAIVDLRYLQINDMFKQIIGKTEAEVIGKSMLELFPNSKPIGAFDPHCQVIETGVTVRFEVRYDADGLNAWFDVSSVKVGENGVVVTFADITDRKNRDLEIQQQKELVQTMLNAAFHGKALLRPIRNDAGVIEDYLVVAANNSTEAQLGVKPGNAIGQKVSSILPGYIDDGGFEMYNTVLETGKPQRAEHFYHDDRIEAWLDVYAAPVNNGVVVSFANITERKQEVLRIQQQKNLLDTILSHSPSGISVTKIIRDEEGKIVDGLTILANEAAIKYAGIPKDIYLSKTAREIDPKIIEGTLFQMAVRTITTGEPFHMQYYLEVSKKWLELSVAKMDDDHLINVFTDVTSSKEAQLQVENFVEKLRTVINTSQAGFFLAKPVRNNDGMIIDFRFTMVNQVLAAFVGKEPGELVGELGSDWFVQYMSNGLFERFRDTFETGVRQQFDIHYIGEEMEVWANVMTAKLDEELLGSFTDFTQMKHLQLQLEKSVEELRRSNSSLQEFAYAASHDLQEPLRKVTLFSSQLRRELEEKLSEDNIKKFDRMQNASKRMSNLINDLLEYSKVSVKPDIFEEVELSEVVELVLQDLEATITETGAVVKVGRLPQVIGDDRQLTQVFQNLISNGLKYRKPGIRPEITVSCRVINERDAVFFTFPDVRKATYYEIEISDNGIGFDQRQAEKIFQVFQRLHSQREYQGTGVGLAIVQKVVQNHKGYIKAKGEPGKGATFTVFLPLS